MKFKYETHCHTSEVSKCSRISGTAITEFYKSKGYTGIVITDHFNDSTTTPPHYKWKDKVDHFFTGFNAALEAGKKLDLDVFFSLEYNDMGNHFLFYGIGRDFLLENPDLLTIGMTKVLQRVRDAGGFIIHAHPFVEVFWCDSIRLVPRLVDAVEVERGHTTPEELDMARRAMWYADEYKLLKTGSSDRHSSDAKNLTGIALEHRATDIMDLVAQIKAGKYEIFKAVNND